MKVETILQFVLFGIGVLLCVAVIIYFIFGRQILSPLNIYVKHSQEARDLITKHIMQEVELQKEQAEEAGKLKLAVVMDKNLSESEKKRRLLIEKEYLEKKHSSELERLKKRQEEEERELEARQKRETKDHK